MADVVAYNKSLDIVVQSGDIRAEHHHNWSPHVREAYVSIIDMTSDTELVRWASPPLTTLWLTPDSQFLIGLSSIKFYNPVQIFIISRDGSFVHSERVRCSDHRLREAGAHCMESVSNYTDWYRKDEPAIELIKTDGQPVALSFNAACNLFGSRSCPPHRVYFPLEMSGSAKTVTDCPSSEDSGCPEQSGKLEELLRKQYELLEAMERKQNLR